MEHAIGSVRISLVVVAVLGCCIGPTVTDATDYCQHENFDARCQDNQVIVMTQAKYGRMQEGRCIQADFGYRGCAADVLVPAHARCSGRRDCEIKIPDPSFDKIVPCHIELVNYLRAEFVCVNVSIPDVETCPPNTTNNITSPSGYLASVITMETGCGNEFSPWQLLAEPGQRINITLFDFRRKTSYVTSPAEAEEERETGSEVAAAQTGVVAAAAQILCKELAIVEEEGIRTPLSSCDGSTGIDPGGTRYTSMGHNVTVYLRSRVLTEDTQFIVKFEVLGCPDIEPTKVTWVTRDSEREISIGCLATDLKWHLTCVGNDWHGEPGNCSAGEIKDARKDGDGASVIIILVVSGIVGVIVLLVGLYCMKKYRARQALQGEMPMKDVRPLNQDDGYDQGIMYARNDAFQPSSRVRLAKQRLTGAGSKTKKGKGVGGHDYEYVWDMTGSAGAPADSNMQTSACVITSGTPKSPRSVHSPLPPTPDMCHCPEIHVHVHHSTENNPEGGQAQVSRVHIQARADMHNTMPRMAATICRTPTSPRTHHHGDSSRTPGTLRAITAPGASSSSSSGSHTPGRYRKGESAHKHLEACSKDSGKSSDHQCHRGASDRVDQGNKRYWTLPVKSAFKSKRNAQKEPSQSTQQDTSG